MVAGAWKIGSALVVFVISLQVRGMLARKLKSSSTLFSLLFKSTAVVTNAVVEVMRNAAF